MGGKEPQDTPSVDDYEFYLADDLKMLDIDTEDEGAAGGSRDGGGRGAPAGAPPRKAPALAERGKIVKTMTAAEALAAALRAEEDKVEQQKQAEERRKKAELAARIAREAAQAAEARRREEEEAAAEEEAEWARQAFGSSQRPGVSVAGVVGERRGWPDLAEDDDDSDEFELPDGAELLATHDQIKGDLVASLMESHRIRAQHDGDLAGAIAFAEVRAALLEDASEVTALRVAFGGEEWAVWVHGGRAIGVFRPADLYLVGV